MTPPRSPGDQVQTEPHAISLRNWSSAVRRMLRQSPAPDFGDMPISVGDTGERPSRPKRIAMIRCDLS